MELREVMQKRKSIRQYLTTPVEEEKVKAMIEAAILAPAVLDALGEGNRKKTQNAPVFLISAVILNRAGFQKDGTADNELGNGWGYYDCGLHDMNLLLEAANQGLSTLVMGLRDADKLREAFDIPKEESIVSVISVGYSDADPDRPTRKSVEEIAKFF